MGDRNVNADTTIQELGPEEAAERILAAHGHEGPWLDAFVEVLDHRRAGCSLVRTLEVWGLSQAEAARLFGVSRQAIGKWLNRGIPPDRVGAISDLAAATDLLVRYTQARPNPGRRAKAYPGSRRDVSGGATGSGGHASLAGDVPRDVPV